MTEPNRTKMAAITDRAFAQAEKDGLRPLAVMLVSADNEHEVCISHPHGLNPPEVRTILHDAVGASRDFRSVMHPQPPAATNQSSEAAHMRSGDYTVRCILAQAGRC